MRTIEWEAPALASLAAAHWLVAYERENSPRKRVRYENEIEFDGVAYMLMCEIELVEREHKAVSMMCGIEPQYTDMPVRIIGNMGKAIGEILPVYNPQNEMFQRFKTKCSFLQNEAYLCKSFFLP
ncbi:hypothetical protein [Barnesiella intestinihominis]|uniref:hypothetical protein n=1 Tax=Barnesiella intestinihominis TaxID=487174 RepID=UPI00266FCF3E|nr:hypothetical protein [Barnesiella intestinihominis]